MASKPLPPLDYLRECFSYEDGIGRLRWRERPAEHFATKRDQNVWNARYAGTLAGTRQRRGYRRIIINCRGYLAHRLIWKLYYGADPASDLDHRNTIPGDDQIENLRVATPSQNSCNSPAPKNSTGYRGVQRSRGAFEARIYVGGKRTFIGRFKTAEAASAAYRKAAASLHGEWVFTKA